MVRVIPQTVFLVLAVILYFAAATPAVAAMSCGSGSFVRCTGSNANTCTKTCAITSPDSGGTESGLDTYRPAYNRYTYQCPNGYAIGNTRVTHTAISDGRYPLNEAEMWYHVYYGKYSCIKYPNQYCREDAWLNYSPYIGQDMVLPSNSGYGTLISSGLARNVCTRNEYRCDASCCRSSVACSGGNCLGAKFWGTSRMSYSDAWGTGCSGWVTRCVANCRMECVSQYPVYRNCWKRYFCSAPAMPAYQRPSAQVCIYTGPEWKNRPTVTPTCSQGAGRLGRQGSSNAVCPPTVTPKTIEPGSSGASTF